MRRKSAEHLGIVGNCLHQSLQLAAKLAKLLQQRQSPPKLNSSMFSSSDFGIHLSSCRALICRRMIVAFLLLRALHRVADEEVEPKRNRSLRSSAAPSATASICSQLGSQQFEAGLPSTPKAPRLNSSRISDTRISEFSQLSVSPS